MPKAMVFIDGTWLYVNMSELGASYGKPDFRLDYGLLPRVLVEEVGKQVGSGDIDVVRTFLFGSYAANYDLQDDELVQRRLDFYNMLREEHHYEVETFAINFSGRRIRKADRDPGDDFEPKEKAVDIALASTLLYFAAVPGAYDIGIAVVGDRDFVPLFQHARRLGKRIAVASIRGSCAAEYADPSDAARVKDFDILWLNDLLNRLELKFEPHQRECEAPDHRGNRMVWTTFRPRKNQRFYCDDCRARFAEQKQQQMREYVSKTDQEGGEAGQETGSGRFSGHVKAKIADKGYGFIHAGNGLDYFFHLTDLGDDLTFDQVSVGLEVSFEVKKEPWSDKAGAARDVRVVKAS